MYYRHYGLIKEAAFGPLGKLFSRIGSNDAALTNAQMVQNLSDTAGKFAPHVQSAKNVFSDVAKSLLTGKSSVEQGKRARAAVDQLFKDYDASAGVINDIKQEAARRVAPYSDAYNALRDGVQSRQGLSLGLKMLRDKTRGQM